MRRIPTSLILAAATAAVLAACGNPVASRSAGALRSDGDSDTTGVCRNGTLGPGGRAC
jgi:hypothetical protein